MQRARHRRKSFFVLPAQPCQGVSGECNRGRLLVARKQRLLRESCPRGDVFRGCPDLTLEQAIEVRRERLCKRIIRIECNCLAEQSNSLVDTLARMRVMLRKCAKIEIVG